MKFEDMINTIQLGDCYELIKNIPDKSIDLVYVDIPYLYDSGGNVKENASALNKRVAKKMNNDLAKIKDGIDYSILDEFIRISKYIYIYVWCSKKQIFDLMDYFIKKHNCNFDILTWCKTNPTPTAFNQYLPDIEYCLLFKEKGAPKFNDDYE